MDKRLIDGLITDMKLKAAKIAKERDETADADRFMYLDGKESVLRYYITELESGKFSDPIPLPTIKPGDKVRHGYYGLGKVQEALDSKHVIVKYYSGEICVITNVIDLEVSHD